MERVGADSRICTHIKCLQNIHSTLELYRLEGGSLAVTGGLQRLRCTRNKPHCLMPPKKFYSMALMVIIPQSTNVVMKPQAIMIDMRFSSFSTRFFISLISFHIDIIAHPFYFNNPILSRSCCSGLNHSPFKRQWSNSSCI